MSSPGGPETFKALEKPQVALDCKQLPRLEALVHSDVSEQTILETRNLRGPISSVVVGVEGSSKPDGPFCFSAELEIDHTSDEAGILDVEAERLASFVQEFAGERLGRPVEEGNSFLINSFSGAYVLVVAPDFQKILITSCSDVPGQGPVDKGSIQELRHGKHASIQEFNYFSSALAGFMTEFYRAYGFNDPLVLTATMPEIESDDSSDGQSPKEPEYKYPMMQDIGGLESVKQELIEFAELLKQPELSRLYGVKPRNGVLLHGSGGTGKTMLAEAFQHELGADMIRLSAADIYNMWLGNSEKAIKKIFDDAEKVTKPTIIYFNEIDGIITPNGHATDSRVAAIFKQGAEKLHSNPNAILWADTNKKLDEIDPNLVRDLRFDIKLYVPLPDERSLSSIIGTLVAHRFVCAERVTLDPLGYDYNRLAQEAYDMTGAQIGNILNKMISRKMLREARENEIPDPISQDEFVQAIRNHRRG